MITHLFPPLRLLQRHPSTVSTESALTSSATVTGARGSVDQRRLLVRTVTLAVVLLMLSAVLAGAANAKPKWLLNARILVASNPTNQDCRTGVCRHNENTDLTRWHRAIYLVHRTASSQILGPNSSLRVYRSRDQGRTFRLQAIIPAPAGRDIRDPCFFVVGRRLFIKAITRLPGFALRDKNAGSITVETHSSDGRKAHCQLTSGERVGENEGGQGTGDQPGGNGENPAIASVVVRWTPDGTKQQIGTD